MEVGTRVKLKHPQGRLLTSSALTGTQDEIPNGTRGVVTRSPHPDSPNLASVAFPQGDIWVDVRHLEPKAAIWRVRVKNVGEKAGNLIVFGSNDIKREAAFGTRTDAEEACKIVRALRIDSAFESATPVPDGAP